MNIEENIAKAGPMVDQGARSLHQALNSLAGYVHGPAKPMSSFAIGAAITGAILGGAVLGGLAVALLTPRTGLELRTRIGGLFVDAEKSVADGARSARKELGAMLGGMKEPVVDGHSDHQSKSA